MFRTRQSGSLIKAFVVMVIMGYVAKSGMERKPESVKVNARGKTASPKPAPPAQRGYYGGDLSLLRTYHEPPQACDESNHYFNLWDGEPSLSALARVNGLTNNHALFIDSHGKAGLSRRLNASGYALYPGQRLTLNGAVPYYAPRDFAGVLGPMASAAIHNIVIAGCNVEGRFRSAEFRQCFPNATNVTYMTPGEMAFKPMFYQAIVVPSSEIRVLYGRPLRKSESRYECELQREPSLDSHPLGVYVADLYVPGAPKPYKTLRAGRELLDPPSSRGAGLRRPGPPSSDTLPADHPSPDTAPAVQGLEPNSPCQGVRPSGAPDGAPGYEE